MLEDLLGVADPAVPLPQIDPDARRRRLTALINTVSLARTEPELFIIEDAHWIDAVSESMLTDFLSVVARTPSMVLITARPEYVGALSRLSGAQTIALAPLADSDVAALLVELLGSDSSVGDLAAIIADRAAGNPFFAQEIVRELVQRGVLAGDRGGYVCRADVADVDVPATVQAAIAARIDRLSTPARQTLNAASVIGAQFGADLLTALGIDPALDELLSAELIDQVGVPPSAEYAFHHALIRAVAYESQLKSDRAQWHRRLATAIQDSEPQSLEENAALIAEHLQAAGELPTAYGWHMRAAAWLTNRDLVAARSSWARASRIADHTDLSSDEDAAPSLLTMRIAPRTMLAATAWRAVEGSRGGFDELRELCEEAGDKLSLAIGMCGLVAELCYAGRSREGSLVASEQTALLESIGDPAPAIGLAFVDFCNWCDAGEFAEILRWSRTVIEMADGDPAVGAGFGIGSPLAAALAWRGVAQWWLGRPRWRQDLDEAIEMARGRNDPVTIAGIVAWTYGLAIQYGVLRADDSALRAVEEAAQIAAGNSNDAVLILTEYTLAVTLLNRSSVAGRQRGVELMTRAREVWLREGILFLVPITELWVARETARRGDHDAVLPLMRNVVADMHQEARLGYGVWATGVLVQTLLERGLESDLAEAEEVIDRLANLRGGQSVAMLDITLLRMRALVARARGNNVAYRDLASRYRAMAKSLGFEGHIDWAEAMT